MYKPGKWRREAKRLQRLLNNGILIQFHGQDILGPMNLEQLGIIIKYGGYSSTEWDDILQGIGDDIRIRVCRYQE